MSIKIFIIFAILVILAFATKSIQFTGYKSRGNNIYSTDEDAKYIWKISKDEETFYNDLFKELHTILFKNNDLIDFDILNYLNIKFISENEIFISCLIREVFFSDKIYVQNSIVDITLKYRDIIETTSNYEVITCETCGSPVSISDKVCKYCRNDIKSYYNWIITDINKKDAADSKN